MFLQYHDNMENKISLPDTANFLLQLQSWGHALGFLEVGISHVDLQHAEPHLQAWLDKGYHGEMAYMQRHGLLRARPAELVPNTVSMICATLPYYPSTAADSEAILVDGHKAFISRYALGRDYHKVFRKKLQQLADKIAHEIGPFGYRVFTDSAPILEVESAVQAGLGWRGKHTLLLNRQAGSFFFLGEILTDLPLQAAPVQTPHCGDCDACIRICPTQAILAPYVLDARRCISYLTIELKGAIPEIYRPLLGNRIYGCDDCQRVCPWNRFAQTARDADFAVRHGLDAVDLVTLFAWQEADFQERMAGSAIYRIGYTQWLRNIAVALGNAPSSPSVLAALQRRLNDSDSIVREHTAWAWAQHQQEQP